MKSNTEKVLKIGKVNGIFSIGGNTLLFGLKLWAGIVSGSVALVVDAWHTLSDSFSSLVMLVGFSISSKPADNEHPFGHGRAEIVSTLIIGIIIVIAGLGFLYKSADRFINPEYAEFGTIAIIVTILSMIIKSSLALYAFWTARKTGFKSVRADAWNHTSDAIAAFVIFIGILFSHKYWWIDPLLGFMLAAIITYTGVKIFRESFLMLLGQMPDNSLKEGIISLSERITGKNLNHHHFHVHSYGNHTEVTFHIKLPGDIRLSESFEITKTLAKKIEEELNIFATIHVDAY